MTLLSLDIACERCGTKPNMRITPAQRDKHLRDPDSEVAGTWRCQQCGETHLLTAGVYKRAKTPNGKVA